MYVYYPHGGEHFMLTHWTHNEQRHIVLGRSPEACLAVVRTNKFIKRECPEILTFERITIVQPTREFQYLVQVRDSTRERELFREYATSLAKEYRTFTGEFPPGFMECPRYVVQSDYTEATDMEHFGCANCQSKVVATRVAVLDLYAAARQRKSPDDDRWRTGGPGRGQVRSRAPYADPARELYEMVSDPGHHCSGTWGRLADPKSGAGQSTLFFYHKEEDLPEWRGVAQKSVADRKAEITRLANKGKSEYHRRMSERNRKRRAEVIAFFGAV